MQKRDIAQLAVYKIDNDADTLWLKDLRDLYLNNTSEIIYVMKDLRLYGIICLEDVINGSRDGKVTINKSFTSLIGFDFAGAYDIFQNKRKITKIPVINEKGELIGDFSRWDDILFIERNQERYMKELMLKRVLQPYEEIFIVEPVCKENIYYIQMKNYFKQFRIDFEIVSKDQIRDKVYKNAICIFIDEDERRGIQCLYGIAPYLFDQRGNDLMPYDLLVDPKLVLRFATYKSLLLQIMERFYMKRLKIERPKMLSYSRFDEKASAFLSLLRQKGITCYAINKWEYKLTNYGNKFWSEVNGYKDDSMKKIAEEEFYDELYLLEDYQNGVAQKEIEYGANIFEYKKNIKGKYFNAEEGRRKTCFQPEKFIGTIYLLGPCTIIGALVEDKHTVGSFLQLKLNEKGYFYKVENYGSMIRMDAEIDSRLKEIDPFTKNDIVIFLSVVGEITGVPGINLERIFERHQIPSKWVKQGHTHCNYKANSFIADDIFEMIEPGLQKSASENTKDKIRINICDIMAHYIEEKFLKQYFTYWSGWKYKAIGAIVMCCDPFHIGHRYLIEQAKQSVDFLIIFLLEDSSGSSVPTGMFSFEERYMMLREGIKDLDNIMIAPNSEFVLSINNFQQYYTKRYDMTTEKNAKYDIEIFTDYIAKSLHITHRFAGLNPKGRVKNIYQKVMRDVLPQKGIYFSEIPRMKSEGEEISSSVIKKYIQDKEYDKVFTFLPDTTKKYLMGQLGLAEESKEKGI